jgi:hypothetical protein
MAETITVPTKQEILNELLTSLFTMSQKLNTQNLDNLSQEGRTNIVTEIGAIHTKLLALSDSETSFDIEDVKALKAEYDALILSGGGSILTLDEQSLLDGLKDDVYNIDDVGTHVIILAGQSNMVGRAKISVVGSDYPLGVLQIARNGRFSGASDNDLVQAVSPLDHHDAVAGSVGLSLTFVKHYKLMFPSCSLVLVPCAKGGSGFSQNNWNKGDFYYKDLVERVNLLFTNNPTFKLKGFLWHQGENDENNLNYEDNLDSMFQDLKKDISVFDDTIPLILGTHVPSWVGSDVEKNVIEDIILSGPNRYKNSAIASSYFPSILGTFDGIHFDVQGYYDLGDRYFFAFINVLEGNQRSFYNNNQFGGGSTVDTSNISSSAILPKIIDSDKVEGFDVDYSSIVLSSPNYQSPLQILGTSKGYAPASDFAHST